MLREICGKDLVVNGVKLSRVCEGLLSPKAGTSKKSPVPWKGGRFVGFFSSPIYLLFFFLARFH